MTPQWNRTDLFLWAGIPYFILLLTNYFRVRPSWACVMAAALAGIEIAIRYASAFLIPAGVLLIVQATWPDRRELIRRVGIFVGVLAVAAFPVVVVLIGTMQHFSQVPAGAMIAYLATLEPADAAWFIISRLPGISNLVFGGPQVMQSVLRLHSQALSTAFGIGCLIVVLTCPFLLWKRHTGSAENRKADLAISFSLISLSLILFLSIAGFGSYFSVNRYFLPLLYLPLLIAYQIASSASGAPAALSRVVLAICVASYLSSFMMLFSENRKWMATYSVVGLRAAAQTTSLPIRYTRPVLFSRVENTRQQVIALSRLYPEANFFAQQYGYFIYDGLAGGPAPGDRFRPIPSRGSLAKMTGCGPQRIFWVVATDRDFDLVPASMQRVTFEDRIERMRIVETYLPAGYQFRF